MRTRGSRNMERQYPVSIHAALAGRGHWNFQGKADARVERRALVVGRAELAKARVRLAAQALEDGLGDP
jgi:hypothetical protein